MKFCGHLNLPRLTLQRLNLLFIKSLPSIVLMRQDKSLGFEDTVLLEMNSMCYKRTE